MSKQNQVWSTPGRNEDGLSAYHKWTAPEFIWNCTETAPLSCFGPGLIMVFTPAQKNHTKKEKKVFDSIKLIQSNQTSLIHHKVSLPVKCGVLTYFSNWISTVRTQSYGEPVGLSSMPINIQFIQHPPHQPLQAGILGGVAVNMAGAQRCVGQGWGGSVLRQDTKGFEQLKLPSGLDHLSVQNQSALKLHAWMLYANDDNG